MDRINNLEVEIQELRKILHEKEKELYEMKCEFQATKHVQTHCQEFTNSCQYEKDSAARTQIGDRLPKWAIERYSRQILLADIGVEGQQKLCAAKVLVVGAGGLGCPAAIYLAGAGIGEIGIVDYDNVDITNIHRQILHGESDQYMSKAESAAQSLRRINSRIKVIPYNIQLDSTNAMQTLATHYDIVLDCTDNVPSRYLLNDLCVLSKVPLISGSALKMEGQLTIYGYRSEGVNEKDPCMVGPCYRCVFPTPPPPDAVGSCSSNGVAGPVPGVIGALQALEAIKYIVGQTYNKLLVERMLIFDGEDITFRTVKLRPRNIQCAVCADNAPISQLLDYEAFCNTQAKEKDLDLKILPPKNRRSALELSKSLSSNNRRHLLVDVRSEPEFQMCRIDGAVNYPIERIHSWLDQFILDVKKSDEVTFVCRRGNDSQVVAQKFVDLLGEDSSCKIKDLAGGLHAWSKDVDPDFPFY